jgi:2-succinyl-5-enolpyruvyl-6-hydroxy-3-cyclohexene-1-carboxylate synthase
LQQSVPSASVVQATFAAALFDEWIRQGLRDVVVCPGSRSTPLVMACAERTELTMHIRIDERSAGFFAIGRALATDRPVAIVVTSGTAAAELLASVAEADQAFVPLLVVTADRPVELHGVGAPQTMDQHNLYGAKVRRFEEPGVVSELDVASWRDIAVRLWGRAIGAPGHPGPVHLNAAFAEPLVAQPLVLAASEATLVERTLIAKSPRGFKGQRVLCVVGRGVTPDVVADCRVNGWVVLGDATSQRTLAYFDSLLRSNEFAERARPDVVVRLGGIPASKVLQERLREWNVPTIGFDGAGFLADPDPLITELLPGLPRTTPQQRGDANYVELWLDESRKVSDWLEKLDADDGALLNEPIVARVVVEASERHGAALVIGSSMPVRDVEWWSRPRRSRTFSNRGVNGIDGVVSTALGVAVGSISIGLVGDITMLHDVSGLVDGVGENGGTCVLVVVDNDGGGIFSFLPQSQALEPAVFERLFGTPRSHDLATIARAFGHQGSVVCTRAELEEAVHAALSAPGLSVVVAKVPTRDENVILHQSWNAMVRGIVESHS